MNSPTAVESPHSSDKERSGDPAWWAIPSWIFSLALHSALLLLFASTILTGGGSPLGSEEGEYRDVGLVERASLVSKTPSDETEVAPADAAESVKRPAENAGLTETPSIDQTPPASLPTAAPQAPVIGPGAAPPGPLVPDVRSPLKPGGVSSPSAAAAAGLGMGTAEFFGVRDKATRVVYVIDCSGSMTNYNAIRAAKSELMASLQGLERTQQFQVLFYNQTVRELSLDGERKPGLYFATDINRTLARQYIDSVPADLGTDHMPALKKALRLTPEVLFFLTDADEPQMTARELNEIKQLNQGRTRIHCIEFGKGAELVKIDNFLKRLARENGGHYRYRDVTRFQARP